MPLNSQKRRIIAILAGALLLFAIPLVYVWVSAPADPFFNGTRLSHHLYRAYGGARAGNPQDILDARQECADAVKHLGLKAGPLLTAWIENRPSPMREKLRDYLRRKNINWPYLTADHQHIVEQLFFHVPEAAVPVSEAFHWQILNGQPRDEMRAASLFMWVINSVDDQSRQVIATRARGLATTLLDTFEAGAEDNYPLALVGPILKSGTEPTTPELRERVLTLDKKSRYLDSAVTFLKDSGN